MAKNWKKFVKREKEEKRKQEEEILPLPGNGGLPDAAFLQKLSAEGGELSRLISERKKLEEKMKAMTGQTLPGSGGLQDPRFPMENIQTIKEKQAEIHAWDHKRRQQQEANIRKKREEQQLEAYFQQRAGRQQPEKEKEDKSLGRTKNPDPAPGKKIFRESKRFDQPESRKTKKVIKEIAALPDKMEETAGKLTELANLANRKAKKVKDSLAQTEQILETGRKFTDKLSGSEIKEKQDRFFSTTNKVKDTLSDFQAGAEKTLDKLKVPGDRFDQMPKSTGLPGVSSGRKTKKKRFADSIEQVGQVVGTVGKVMEKADQLNNKLRDFDDRIRSATGDGSSFMNDQTAGFSNKLKDAVNLKKKFDKTVRSTMQLESLKDKLDNARKAARLEEKLEELRQQRREKKKEEEQLEKKRNKNRDWF